MGLHSRLQLVCPTAIDQFDTARPAESLSIGLWVDRLDCEASVESAAQAMQLLSVVQPDAQFRGRVRALAEDMSVAGGVPRAADVLVAEHKDAVGRMVELQCALQLACMLLLWSVVFCSAIVASQAP